MKNILCFGFFILAFYGSTFEAYGMDKDKEYIRRSRDNNKIIPLMTQRQIDQGLQNFKDLKQHQKNRREKNVLFPVQCFIEQSISNHLTNSKIKTTQLTEVNFFRWTSNFHLFEGHDFKKLKLDEELYTHGWGEAAALYDENIVSVNYAIYNIEKLNVIEKDLSHGTINHIATQDVYRNQGFATYAVRKLVDFIFNSTDVDWIVASVSDFRPRSAKVFQKCGFTQNDQGAVSLDGGKTIFSPKYYLGTGGNWYLSRYDFENKPNLSDKKESEEKKDK